MPTIALCSASGSPGVTSTALGLTLTWPRDVLLVDSDRTPSQAILAGYLRGTSSQGRGLPALLQAHREHQHMLDAVPEQWLELPEPPHRQRKGEEQETAWRRFLPGFTHLGTIDLFNAVWRELGLAFRDGHYDVIMDLGRIGARGLPQDLVDTVDRVIVVCRTSLVALAALRLYLGPLVDQVEANRIGLALVGPGRPYGAKEVSEQFGLPVLAEIAWDPRAAGDLSEGATLGSRWRSQRLARSFAASAWALAGHGELTGSGQGARS